MSPRCQESPQPLRGCRRLPARRLGPALFRLGLFAFAALAAFCAPSLTPGPALAEARFFADLPEVPLPEGFAEHRERAVLFDKPGGRIAVALASGQGEEGEVRAFYEATLPALGWRSEGAGRWRRESEQLSLDFEREGGRLYMLLRLSP